MTIRLTQALFAFALSIAALCAASAHAGSITASYSFQTQPLDTTQPVNFTANFGIRNNESTIAFLGTRLDQPPGPGVDTFVPPSFMSYCVELGEPLFVPFTNTHSSVVPLLGSTTQAGGFSGPVFFDATRTANMQTLWGSYSSLVPVNPLLSPVFQLAVWEIAFDDDMTLNQQLGSRFWVDPVQSQPGITNVAESWLSDIRNGVVTNQSPLVLLTHSGLQDLITTPEPATASLFGLVMLLALRRRR